VNCTGIDEFNEDIKRIKYIKKLLTRYENSGELNERLVLNHLIILNNVFGPEFLSMILYLKMKNCMRLLKPFLVFLSIMPDIITGVNDDSVIYTDVIDMDQHIVEVLRKI